MINLYVKTYCGFCRIVEDTMARMQIPYNLKNLDLSPTYQRELIEIGGKYRAPFLHHHRSDGEVKMYESADIIGYIKENCVPASKCT